MADLVLRKNNSGVVEVQIWEDKSAGQKKDIRNYTFVWRVYDERESLIWQYEKNEYDSNDNPQEGYFRMQYGESLTSNVGTFIYRLNMIGSETLTIIDGNLVIR